MKRGALIIGFIIGAISVNRALVSRRNRTQSHDITADILAQFNGGDLEDAFANAGCLRKYDYGDVVRLEGDLYTIDGWTLEAARFPDMHTEDITYDLTRVEQTGDWSDFATAHQDELKFVGVPHELAITEVPKMEIEWSKPKKALQPTHRDVEKVEISRRKEYRAKVNELLDAYNAAMAAGDDEKAAKVRAEYDRRTAVFNGEGPTWLADILAEGGE